MQWIRLDVGFPRNHKVLALLDQRGGERALMIYVFGLCYAGEQSTDGFIPREATRQFGARYSQVTALLDLKLWHEIDGGFVINDWAEFQPSTEENKRRSEHAREAAKARWNGRQK